MLLTKDFETVQEPVKLQDPDLLAIRKYAQRDVTPDEVWCSAFKVCNTKVDRSGERFTKAYLERFAETLPGKAVLEGHRRDIRPLGRVYNAEVLPDGGDWFLKGYWYTAADSPVRREVELGIAKDCSIGYAAGKRTCSIDQKMWLPMRMGECKEHQPLQEYDGQTCTIHYCDTEAHKAEGQEVSLVWLGCQYGAEATVKRMADERDLHVALSTSGPEVLTRFLQHHYPHRFPVTIDLPREEKRMFKTIEEAEVEIKRLQALPLAAEREAELQKAIAEKEPLAKDGAAYRDYLRAEILRMAGALDEATKTSVKGDQYKAILAHMEGANAETLAAVLKGIEPEFTAMFTQGAGATGGEPANSDRTKTKSSPFGRMALGGLR